VKYEVEILDIPFERENVKRPKTAQIIFNKGEPAEYTEEYGLVEAGEVEAAIAAKENINIDYCYVASLSLRNKTVKSFSAIEAFLDETDFFEAKLVGDTEFFKAKFGRNADFSLAKFAGKTNFSRSKFAGDMHFSMAMFDKNVHFFMAEFYRNADFSQVNFTERTDFGKSQFDGETDFSGAKFREVTDFFKAKLRKKVDFSRAEFDRTAFFREAEFGGFVYFSGGRFDGETDFSGADFDETVYFSGAKFSGETDFSGVKFSGVTEFVEAEFDGKTNFSGANFSEKVYFRKAEFGGKVYFSGAKFSETADFSEIKFCRDAKFEQCKNPRFVLRFELTKFEGSIIMTGISAKKLNLKKCTVKETLELTGITVETLELTGMKNLGHVYIEWERDGVKKAIHNQLKNCEGCTMLDIAYQFRLLKENFRSRGQYDDEDKAYVEFRRAEAISMLNGENEKKGRTWKRIACYYFKKVLFDYIGVYATKPWRVLLALVGMIIIFGVLYWGLEGDIKPATFGDQKLIAALYYSAITTFTVGFGDISPTNIYVAILTCIEAFFGVFMMSYFTVAFARKVLR